MGLTSSDRPAPMRVLHAFKVYLPDTMGGVPEVLASLTADTGTERRSSILVARKSGWNKSYAIDGVPVEAVASFGDVLSLPLAPSFPFVLARRARNVDLVVLHAPFPLNDIGAALGIPDRVALVVHWHGEIVGRRPLARLIAPFVRHTLARAQRIIVSDRLIVEASPFIAPHAHKCAIIPYGVDASYWGALNDAQRVEVERLRATYPRLVVGTGRLVPYKGFEFLVRALPMVDATAVIVGEGALRPRLLDLARQFGVADRLILAGALSRDALKVHLHAARAFVFPSVSPAETFGIAQAEAMAAGRPIVNTNLSTAVPKVARHEREALTVAPRDPAALAHAIRRLLDDEPLARRLGEAAQARVAAEYPLQNFVRGSHAVYEQAIAEVRAGR